MAISALSNQPVRTLSMFLSRLRRLKQRPDTASLYRGHADKDFQLRPSVVRSADLFQKENLFIREFVSAFPNEFSGDETTLEKLVRAQHYSIPTRLLDLSWNPLVALYFAVERFDDKNAEVIIFHVARERIKYYDSDSVAIFSNLANLTKEDKEELRPIFARGRKPTVKQLHETDAFSRLMHFIRSEKPHFEPKIEPALLNQTLFVQPKLNNRRILAQSGAFAIVGVKHIPSSSGGFSKEVLEVDAGSKVSLRNELRMVGIHRSSLFPEIENAAEFIRERLGLGGGL